MGAWTGIVFNGVDTSKVLMFLYTTLPPPMFLTVALMAFSEMLWKNILKYYWKNKRHENRRTSWEERGDE